MSILSKKNQESNAVCGAPPPGNPFDHDGTVAVVVLQPLEAGAVADAYPGGAAVDLDVRACRLWQATFYDDRVEFASTDEVVPRLITRFFAVDALAPPTVDDAARERLADAIADILQGEVAP